MNITLEVILDCENPNGCQIPSDVLTKLLEDILTERQVLVYNNDKDEWQLFINSYTIEIKEINEHR